MDWWRSQFEGKFLRIAKDIVKVWRNYIHICMPPKLKDLSRHLKNFVRFPKGHMGKMLFTVNGAQPFQVVRLLYHMIALKSNINYDTLK